MTATHPVTLTAGGVSVEVDLVRRLPGIVIIGLPGGAVREVGDTARQMVEDAGDLFPRLRVVVNVTPAQLRISRDVAVRKYAPVIAAAVRLASGQWEVTS